MNSAKTKLELIGLQRKLWPTLFVCFFLFLAVTAHAQSDSLLAPQPEDYAKTVAARQLALTELLAQAEQARGAGNASAQVQFLHRAARLKLRLSLYSEALALYQSARQLLTNSPNPPLLAENLNGAAMVLTYQAKCHDADDLTAQALTLSRDLRLIGAEADILLTQSFCQREQNQRQALATAQESLRLWNSINNSWGIANAYQAVGQYQLSLNLLVEAKVTFDSALPLWRTLGLQADEAESVMYLGFLDYRKGAWQDAIVKLTEAEQMLDPDAEPYKLAQITITIGESLLESGMPEAALSEFELALEYYRRAQVDLGRAAALWDLGRANFVLDNTPQALAQLESSLELASTNGSKYWQAHSNEMLGRVYATSNEITLALSHYQEAQDLYQDLGDELEIARIGLLIGQVAQSRGQVSRAREQYQRALSTFDRLNDRQNQSWAWFSIGALELQQNDLDHAEESLRKSLEDSEDLRSSYSNADLAAGFAGTVYDRQAKYVECLMRKSVMRRDLGYALKAFEASDLSRSRSLAEMLRTTDIIPIPGVDQALAERARDLRHLRQASKLHEIRLLTQRPYPREELDLLRSRQKQFDDEYARVSAEISQKFPEYEELTAPTGWNLDQIQQRVVVDDQTVLLEYSLGEDKSYVWAVTRTSFASYELPGRGQIDAAAQTVYKMVSDSPAKINPAELAAAQRELSRLILAPVAGELNKNRVIVVADGVLNYLPFQSLPDPADNSHLMVERYEIVNAASASILGALRKESAVRRPPTKLLAAFGNPVFPGNYAQVTGTGADTIMVADASNDRWRHALRDIEISPDSLANADIQPLPFSKQELMNLRSVAEGDSLIASEFDASRENLLHTDLSQYSILHFATHGLLDPKRPEISGLVLSTVDRDRKSQNGFVGLQDIYSLNAPVDLVVLSACRTGLGKDVKGEGLIGLTRGFMYAGASTVVASLWKVDDDATAALMKEFYTNLLEKGMTTAEALRAAQNTIRSKPGWSSPYYWAAFTIQGEYRAPLRPVRAPMAPGLAKRVTVAAAILGLLTVVAWWSRRRSLVLAQRS